ncbi:MAG TPA: Crp/Fnr family transcriptional regulator [Gaiellaceae bacterium]|nr:Crp/Fnr family transcriptional regulator [Gaiellaceae bacterium]
MEWELFAGVPEENVRRLLSIARRRTFDRGEVVFHRGDPADCLHLIVSGRFAVGITTPLGATALLGVRGPGDAFGELALVADAEYHRSATVAALEPSETRSVLAGDFERLRREHPSVDGLLVRLLGERVRRLSEQVTEAYYLPAEKRVLRRLVELGELYGGCIPLPQEQLAELAGTSRATANRVLRDLQRRGVLELGRSSVVVVEPEELRRRTGRLD